MLNNSSDITMKYITFLIFCKKLINCFCFTEYDRNVTVKDTNLTIVEKLDDSLAKLLKIPDVDVSEETKFWNHTIWNNQTILKLATYIAAESKEKDSDEDYNEGYEEEGKKEEQQQVKDYEKKGKMTTTYTKYDLVDKSITLNKTNISQNATRKDAPLKLKLNTTMLETLLHEKIFNIETDKIKPLMKNVSINEIIKNFKAIKHCFMLAKDDGKGRYDEYLRNSSQLVYDKGGPEFIRVGIHNLLEEYSERQLFSDDDIKIIQELFDDAFNAWYELRHRTILEEAEEQDKHARSKKQLF